MAETRTWRLAGRTPAALPPDWRERLVARLGQRPRRLGLHTELALYGALEAQAAACERQLPSGTLLRLCSVQGPVSAIGQVLEQLASDLPLPFSFLQSQPSQALAALANALDWQGDASIVLARDPRALVALAAQQAGPHGLLLGWVEEAPARSDWLRLVPCPAPAQPFVPLADLSALDAPGRHWLQLRPEGLALASELFKEP